MLNLLYLIAGLFLLMYSANWLVRGSVQVARHLNISPLIIGLTIVSLGTSAPELFVSTSAAIKGSADIAIGNVVGSNIANIALILGMVALIVPVRINERGLWRDWSAMMGASLLLWVVSLDHYLSRVEGFLFLGIFIAYLVWTIKQSRASHSDDHYKHAQMKMSRAIWMIVVSIAGLYFGADLLILGARNIALHLGLSERMIAVTIVAFGTSLPEFVTSLVASFRKENEISLGNIIGSNIFNILGILGVTSVIHPIQINPLMVANDYWWMIGVAALLLVVMVPLRKGIINRGEALMLIGVYVAYVYLLF